MPHVIVKMIEGKTPTQLEEMATKIKQSVIEAVGCDASSVSLSYESYTRDEWKEIYKQEITEKPDNLYIAPGYDPATW